MSLGLNSNYLQDFKNLSLKSYSNFRETDKQAKSFTKEHTLKSGLQEFPQIKFERTEAHC